MTSTLNRFAIHGVPRSGTSWLGEIINSSPFTTYRFQPLFSYVLKDYLSTQSSKADISDFFEKLRTTEDKFLNQTENRSLGILPNFRKEQASHVCYKEVRYHHILENCLTLDEELRLIAIIRDPLAVLASWASSPREFRVDLGWQFSREWRYAESKNQGRPEEFFGYEKWKEATLLFQRLERLFPDRVLIIKYENLCNKTSEIVQLAFRHCGLKIHEQTKYFLKESMSLKNVESPYSVYKAGLKRRPERKILDKGIIAEVIHDLESEGLTQYLELRG